MKNILDEMLRHALTPSDEPNDQLNQSIVNSAKKMHNAASETDAEMEVAMRKSWIKKAPAVAMAVAVIISAGGLSAYAAWKYMKPDQIAEELGDKKLSDAFLEKGAVSIGESQSYAGYTTTLLGTISGENLSQYQAEHNGELLTDRTYAVLTIEKEDGTPMTMSEQDFLASPLIHGEDPRMTNIYTMNGGRSYFIEDGIMYQIIDCDNLEVFANRGVYLCVLNSTFYQADAFSFDKKSGDITRNNDYDGLNALFCLPLDTSKGDEEKAEQQLRQWNKEMAGDDETDSKEEENTAKKWTLAKLKKEAKVIPETVQTITPDKDGYIHYAYSYGATSSESDYLTRGLFKKAKTILIEIETYTSEGKALITTCTKNGDGTMTLKVYCEK